MVVVVQKRTLAGGKEIEDSQRQKGGAHHGANLTATNHIV
jgi:hypothetical protein